MSGCEGECLARGLGIHAWVPGYLGRLAWEAALNHHWPDAAHAFPTTATTLGCHSHSGSSSLGRHLVIGHQHRACDISTPSSPVGVYVLQATVLLTLPANPSRPRSTSRAGLPADHPPTSQLITAPAPHSSEGSTQPPDPEPAVTHISSQGEAPDTTPLDIPAVRGRIHCPRYLPTHPDIQAPTHPRTHASTRPPPTTHHPPPMLHLLPRCRY